MRAYGGRIFRLAQHLERLYASAQYLGLRLPDDPQRLSHRLTRALADSGLREAVVRVAMVPPPAASAGGGSALSAQARRAASGGGMVPDAFRAASPMVVVQPVQPPTVAMYARGIRVAVVPTRRFPVSQIDPQSKFSSRLGSVMAVIESHLRHTDEALFMDALGYVTESTASNVGIIKRGIFLAPPCWLGLLAGITWQALVEAAQTIGLPYRETPLTRHDLYNADEAFLSSTLKEILAVTKIDGRRIGTGKPGPSTKRLHRGFRQLVKRELDGRC